MGKKHGTVSASLASAVSGLQIEDTALIKAAADSNLDKRSYYGDR
jgi:hypothetical protein